MLPLRPSFASFLLLSLMQGTTCLRQREAMLHGTACKSSTDTIQDADLSMVCWFLLPKRSCSPFRSENGCGASVRCLEKSQTH